MARTSSRRRWALFVVLAVVLFAAFLWVRPLLHIGAGYAAKHACSCHFLQERNLADISERDLNFSVLGWASLSTQKHEAGDGAVRASFLGLVPRVAVFRAGVGCTLINDERLPVKPVQSGRRRAGAGEVVKSSVRVDYLPALEEALEFGMEPVPGGGARGLVILQDGVVVGERYGEGFDDNTLQLGWSATKTLVGMAWGYNRSDSLGPRSARRAFERPVDVDSLNNPGALRPYGRSKALETLVNHDELYPAWAADARANIELNDLLHMNSGLAWNEGYGSITDATVMLHEQPNMAAYAAGMFAEEAPGELWNYSSGTTNVLTDLLLQDLLATNQNVYQLFDHLYGRVAPSLIIEPDQSGRPVGSSYGWATARDWARLGQLMLQDGVWEGDTLLQPGWVDYMRQPAAGSNGTYGAQLWLPGPDMPSLPADAFMMRGFQDQRVFVIPSRDVVIARLGHGEDKVTDFEGLVRRVLAALP